MAQTTIEKSKQKLPPPRGFVEFLAALGAEEDAKLDDLCLVPEGDLVAAFDTVEVNDAPLTSMQRAALVRYIRMLFTMAGYAPPGMGSAVPEQRPPKGTPSSQPADQQCNSSEVPASLVNLGEVVDQKLRAQVSILTFGELSQLRSNFERITGAPPPEEHLPTGEQLSGLRALLSSGRVPFVDFAIWSSLGPRLAKFRKTEASVFSGGAFVTRTIDGPTSFQDWEASWSLFSVAMISLGAASPGALQAYLAGMRTLLRLFPARWGQIMAADLVVRSERWTRLREDFERLAPPGFCSARPWDHVISASAFGKEGPNSTWWSTHFVLPATLNVALPSTAGVPSISSGGSKPKRDPPPASSAPRASSSPSGPALVCKNWNNKAGYCKSDGACPDGRHHICIVCGGNHRAVDAHWKGKGGGKKGGKGSKGRGKGKKGGLPADVSNTDL